MRMGAGAIRAGLCMGVLHDRGMAFFASLGCLRREFGRQDDKARGGVSCLRTTTSIPAARSKTASRKTRVRLLLNWVSPPVFPFCGGRLTLWTLLRLPRSLAMTRWDVRI